MFSNVQWLRFSFCHFALRCPVFSFFYHLCKTNDFKKPEYSSRPFNTLGLGVLAFRQPKKFRLNFSLEIRHASFPPRRSVQVTTDFVYIYFFHNYIVSIDFGKFHLLKIHPLFLFWAWHHLTMITKTLPS